MDLYHGSPFPGLSVLQPHPSRVMDGEVVVFASQYRDVAISFLVPWTDKDIEQGSVNGKFYMKEMYPGAFERFRGKAGSIYIVSADGFKKDSRLTRYERYSVSPVIVFKEERIVNAYEALEKSFFVLSKRILV